MDGIQRSKVPSRLTVYTVTVDIGGIEMNALQYWYESESRLGFRRAFSKLSALQSARSSTTALGAGEELTCRANER